ncbi:uncharacterized protein SAPINGB_P002303 [Magnusiomyces paraingens]|uniref:Uncharacterized protein n=1 Tax=Magnusiomyces paraingens TaxID=2606893 RepID=A0A5E8BJ35_9ASCO|nr:uncharacterized protein SAPINGB_P002303 [Saprochaete ingens]VVT49506.1 unnamed protein product [Saprochaete ingens]
MSTKDLIDIYAVPGKVAVITGSSRGLGYDMAEALLLGGAARVYISSRKVDACAKAVSQLNAIAKEKNLPGKAYSIPADVSTKAGADALRAAFDKVNKEEGLEPRADIVIANAGATWAEEIEKFPDSAFAKVMDLNVRGVFFTVVAFLDLLRKAGTPEDPARVIITGSVAGLTGLMPNGFAYNASKAGVHQLGKQLAVDLGPQHISVNILAPGFFPSKMTAGFLSGGVGDHMAETNPLKRLGLRSDIIGVTLFLTSKASAYVNGVVLPLDGGSHVGAPKI